MALVPTPESSSLVQRMGCPSGSKMPVIAVSVRVPWSVGEPWCMNTYVCPAVRSVANQSRSPVKSMLPVEEPLKATLPLVFVQRA